MKTFPVLVIWLSALAGCAGARTATVAPPSSPRPVASRAEAADSAGADLVVDAWRLGGSAARSAPAARVVDLYRAAAKAGTLHHRKRPARGDAVFFHDSCDANADGAYNDPLTLAGVVERVDADGTVVLVTRVRQGVVRLRMNLERPAVRRDPSTHKVLNHYLAAPADGRPARTTAQLWAAFASPPPSSGRLALR